MEFRFVVVTGPTHMYRRCDVMFRTRGLDGGPDDDVVMGKVNLSP